MEFTIWSVVDIIIYKLYCTTFISANFIIHVCVYMHINVCVHKYMYICTFIFSPQRTIVKHSLAHHRGTGPSSFTGLSWWWSMVSVKEGGTEQSRPTLDGHVAWARINLLLSVVLCHGDLEGTVCYHSITYPTLTDTLGQRHLILWAVVSP